MRKGVYASLLAIWIGSAIGLAAQNRSSDAITAVGCVNRAVADGSLTGSPGVAPAPPNLSPTLANSAESTGALLLNGAVIRDGTEGTAGSATPSRPRSFQLDGAVRELERHLGHRVEVKGTLRASVTSAADAQKTKVDHIAVTSVRMLEASCEVQEPQR